MTVQLSDSDWVGKVGDKVNVVMQFDKGQPWKATATAFKAEKDIALQLGVDAAAIDDWMDDFKESFKLLIVFAGTKVPSWNADLTGTKAIGTAMEASVDAMPAHHHR